MALSPWPAAADARDALREALHAPGLSDDRIDALGSVASALVERHAPQAPQAVRNEAVIRTAGWIHGRPRGGEIGAGCGRDILSRRWPAGHMSALRHSGRDGVVVSHGSSSPGGGYQLMMRMFCSAAPRPARRSGGYTEIISRLDRGTGGGHDPASERDRGDGSGRPGLLSRAFAAAMVEGTGRRRRHRDPALSGADRPRPGSRRRKRFT